MTKQDYEALAALVKVQRLPMPGGVFLATEAVKATEVNVALDNLARDMAQYMSRNPHFDTARFLAAAGVA